MAWQPSQRRAAHCGHTLSGRRVELHRRAGRRGPCRRRRAPRSLPAASSLGRLGRAAAAFASMATAPTNRNPVGRPFPPRHARPGTPRRHVPLALARRACSSAAPDASVAAHGASGDGAATARHDTWPAHRLFPTQGGPVVGAVPPETRPSRHAEADSARSGTRF